MYSVPLLFAAALFLGERTMDITIKKLTAEEYPEAYELAWEVFTEYEAPLYPKRGADSFHEFLYSGEIEKRYHMGLYDMYICCADGKPAAVGSIRDGSHLSLLFTRTEFQRKGLASMLVRKLAEDMREKGEDIMTVNASPYGVPFYKAIGFLPVGMESMTDGIIYTPMAVDIDKLIK